MKLFNESNVQEALANHYRNLNYTVIREYETPVGYIDLLVYNHLEKIIIETKDYSGIKHAIGQILCYKQFIPNYTKLQIITFSSNGKHKNIKPIYRNLANQSGIELYSINELISLEDIITTKSNQKEHILCLEAIDLQLN